MVVPSPQETKEVMYMNSPAKRPFGRTLGIAVLAVLVALVAAVSAFAVGGSSATADNPASAPAQTQPVQDSQAPPERGERSGPGGREDCPEKDGDRRRFAAGEPVHRTEHRHPQPGGLAPGPPTAAGRSPGSGRRGTFGQMTVSVREGRLSEVPTAAATGMDRRAFGEFEGPRGELASYALGWATDTEPRAARLTVGIGAGNPGGATFHALVAVGDDGGCACSLIDDPFEDVPEGGPHLDAEAARAHEDLPFIWAVTDAVMARDRRAWWMRHWLLGTPAILTPEVFERHEPILLVSNDADDELWQLIGRATRARRPSSATSGMPSTRTRR